MNKQPAVMMMGAVLVLNSSVKMVAENCPQVAKTTLVIAESRREKERKANQADRKD